MYSRGSPCQVRGTAAASQPKQESRRPPAVDKQPAAARLLAVAAAGFHDIMLLMGRAQDIGLRLARHARKGSIDAVREQADMLVGVLQQIVIGMRDVQSLFRSSRRRRQALKVEPILDKIHGIYAGLLEKLEITYRKSVVGKSPLVANTTDGVIMQVLINLFDNAAYWLETKAPPAPREIRVTLDGDAGELVFADSGPGVDGEDKPYIFEAFFSGKGQEGRGLGLYPPGAA